jgi:hypothetical protein
MKFLEHEAEYRRAMAAMQSGQFSRREVLRKMGAGFGSLGLAGMLQQSGLAGTVAKAADPSPLAPKVPHFAPKAKHVIQLFMPGGPSPLTSPSNNMASVASG